MSTAIQERQQMIRMPLDKWSKREQLCLASAVSCSGDQNWITVSRTLKAVCGNETRPVDWYSQKNCAVQYGHLLESVEATKRKKRSSEGGAGVSSPAAVEPPTELLLRRLTEERLLEIKAQMRRDQDMYSKVYREIEALQSNELDERELQEMWQQIENQQETQRIDEMKLENRMREREQRKREMIFNWRKSGNNGGAARRANAATDTTAVDMDVEDIGGSANTGNSKSLQHSAPSPLLTSLLKSPTATSSTLITPTAGTGSVARVTAPTITSLLTSGAGVIPNQPAVTLKNSTDSTFMTRPISGPPVAEIHSPTAPTTGRSPSQAAPTLSMLLEKNKLAAAASKAGETNTSVQSFETKSPEQATIGSEHNSKSMTSAATTIATAADSDEADDEQQLLEVFKNMDDIIDDIDIDMAGVIDEDILKDVDNDINSPTAAHKSDIDFEDKPDEQKPDQTAKPNNSSTKVNAGEDNVMKTTIEVVTGSSDDSNDNIPLAAVASLESKERNYSENSGATENAETGPLASEVAGEEISESVTVASNSSEDNPEEILNVPASEHTADKVLEPSDTDAAADEKGDGDASTTTTSETTDKASVDNISDKIAIAEAKKVELSKATLIDDKSIAEPKSLMTTALHSVQDTDEESSSLTDSSKPEEPRGITKTRRSHPRKRTCDEAKTELEHGAAVVASPQPPSSAVGGLSTSAARPPLLRKLPHRDRSESPMVEDDIVTASDQSATKIAALRRCSSTPLMDSIPNSPASSEHTDDRRETRGASKKLFLCIYSSLNESKHASLFRRAFHDEHTHKHADLCLRPMDLPTIKRNIDSGVIRSIIEMQRDVLLMCHNVLLVYSPQTQQHRTARLFLQECQALKELGLLNETNTTSSYCNKSLEKEKVGGNKARSGSRKSQRHH